MAQLNWIYYSLTGFPYSIDMYHGEDSGHLILFVNSEIILIEFDQKEGSSHSFYIESQLLEFKIEGEEPSYDYTITPQIIPYSSSSGEKYFDEHFWIPLIIIIIAVNLIIVFLMDIQS